MPLVGVWPAPRARRHGGVTDVARGPRSRAGTAMLLRKLATSLAPRTRMTGAAAPDALRPTLILNCLVVVGCLRLVGGDHGVRAAVAGGAAEIPMPLRVSV